MKTDITILLDRSGSMVSIASDAIGGLNSFINDQKKVKGKADLTLIQFDDRYEIILDNVDLKNVSKVKMEPRGMTALLDAIGKTIKRTRKRLKESCECCVKPDKVIFVIITDGYENASTKFTQKDIAKMIKHQQDSHDWDFIFLGSNQDSFTIAGDWNIKRDNICNYMSTSCGVKEMFDTVSVNMTTYRSSIESGSFFSKDDQDKLSN